MSYNNFNPHITANEAFFNQEGFYNNNVNNNVNNKSSIGGGATAAPTTAKILKRILPILGLPKKINTKPELIVTQKGKLNLASY